LDFASLSHAIRFSKELANIQLETDTISLEKAEFLQQKENVEKQQAEAQRKFDLQLSLIEKEESTLKDLIGMQWLGKVALVVCLSRECDGVCRRIYPV
jgi:hypothetical protein